MLLFPFDNSNFSTFPSTVVIFTRREHPEGRRWCPLWTSFWQRRGRADWTGGGHSAIDRTVTFKKRGSW